MKNETNPTCLKSALERTTMSSDKTIQNFIFLKITSSIVSSLRYAGEIKLPKNPLITLDSITADNRLHRNVINKFVSFNVAERKDANDDVLENAAEKITNEIKKILQKVLLGPSEQFNSDEIRIRQDCAGIKIPTGTNAADYIVGLIKRHYSSVDTVSLEKDTNVHFSAVGKRHEPLAFNAIIYHKRIITEQQKKAKPGTPQKTLEEIAEMISHYPGMESCSTRQILIWIKFYKTDGNHIVPINQKKI